MRSMHMKTMQLKEIFSELGGLSSAIMFVTLVPLSAILFEKFMQAQVCILIEREKQNKLRHSHSHDHDHNHDHGHGHHHHHDEHACDDN